jgi:hypothetical protein
MMRYVGSIVGAGILAGLLSDHASSGDVAMFRVVTGAVVATAALAVVAATLIHRFAPLAAVPVEGDNRRPSREFQEQRPARSVT